MTSLTKLPQTLQFNLQDVFFPHTSPDGPKIITAPISSETWHNWFKIWLLTLLSDIPKAESYELSLRLTDDLEIQALNAQYRQKDQPTDVLAFATLETDFPILPQEEATEPLYLGDIVISVETAIRQAQAQGHSLMIELSWLASHGFLHLLGWDHPDEDHLIQMLYQQETLLRKVGLLSQEDHLLE